MILPDHVYEAINHVLKPLRRMHWNDNTQHIMISAIQNVLLDLMPDQYETLRAQVEWDAIHNTVSVDILEYDPSLNEENDGAVERG